MQFMQNMDVQTVLVEFLNNYSQDFFSNKTIWVALSGGVDSVVLLHSLKQVVDQLELDFPVSVKAVHVNHGLSKYADEWQDFCEQYCKQKNVEIVCRKVWLNKNKNVEQQARILRYEVFSQVCDAGDVLLMAHHANDQAETFLFRVLRGMHPQALSCIPVSRLWNQILILRPLLSFTRGDILAYAQAYQLDWVEDESNLDIKFSRNFIRHSILPLIEQYWPKVVIYLAQLAQNFQQHNRLLLQIANQDLSECAGKDAWLNSWGNNIKLEKFLKLSEQRQKNIILMCLSNQHFSFPTEAAIEQLLLQCTKANAINSNSSMNIIWKDGSHFFWWRYFEGHLFYGCEVDGESNSGDEVTAKYSFKATQKAQFEIGCWMYQMNEEWVNLLENESCRIGFRQGGERCRPKGRKHSQTLKKLFQEYRIPSWERSHIPILFYQQEVIAVGDVWVCENMNTQLPTHTLAWRRRAV